jgi:hypothetical protein
MELQLVATALLTPYASLLTDSGYRLIKLKKLTGEIAMMFAQAVG